MTDKARGAPRPLLRGEAAAFFCPPTKKHQPRQPRTTAGAVLLRVRHLRRETWNPGGPGPSSQCALAEERGGGRAGAKTTRQRQMRKRGTVAGRFRAAQAARAPRSSPIHDVQILVPVWLESTPANSDMLESFLVWNKKDDDVAVEERGRSHPSARILGMPMPAPPSTQQTVHLVAAHPLALVDAVPPSRGEPRRRRQSAQSAAMLPPARRFPVAARAAPATGDAQDEAHAVARARIGAKP